MGEQSFICPAKNDLFGKINLFDEPNSFDKLFHGQFSKITPLIRLKDMPDSSYYFELATAYMDTVWNTFHKWKENVYRFMIMFPVIMPIVYNCRHAIELAIKGLCLSNGFAVENTHNLSKNWKNTKIFDYEIEKFIGIIDCVDENGVMFRYPFDTQGSLLENKREDFINLELFVRTTQECINAIRLHAKDAK